MPEQYREFDELKPAQALEIMAQAAGSGYLDLLQHVQIAMTEQSRRVSLFVPESYRGSQKQFGIQFLQAQFEAITGRSPRIGVSLPEGTLLVSSGVAQLLYLTHNEMRQKELEVVTAEYLLVGIEQQDTAELTEQLRIHATHLEVAKGEASGRTCTVFHVVDDKTRRSTFSGILAAGLFANWHLLKTISCEDYNVFLPLDIYPEPEALSSFCRLLKNAPSLFSQQPLCPDPDHKLLAALTPYPDSGRVELLFLRSLCFDDQLLLSPSVARYTHFSICDLADSPEKMRQLHDEIESLEPRVGHRLELRATRFREEVDVERERLRRELRELRYELELVDVYNLSRPKLLRFTAAQLSTMGRWLSELPGEMLRDGSLLYGFQATDRNPDGLHFVYINPTIKEPDWDPTSVGSRLDSERPMRFWLDPFWAHYYSSKNRSHLFVPEFTTLFPSVHDWNVGNGEMDAYLQRAIRHWLLERTGTDLYAQQPFPKIPIYIFDGPCDIWGDIEIFVLDLTTFRPLNTYLSWLNDNLRLQQARVVEPIMEQVAADIVWTNIAKQTRQHKGEVERDFVATSSQLTQSIAGQTAILMQALTQKLGQLQAAAEKQRQAISDLRVRLDQITALVSITQQVERREVNVRQRMDEFRQTHRSVRDEVESFQRSAAKAIDETNSEIDRLLLELTQAYEREERKLNSLTRPH